MLASKQPRIRSLVFQFSRHCPLECGHCYISASPREKLTLDVEKIKASLAAIAKVEPNCPIGFTGGDPFSRIRALREISSAARTNNLRISINTSAFFAKNVAVAEKILGSVEFDVLEVSYDRFHKSFLPFSYAKNCITAARNLSRSVEIHVLRCDYDSNFDGVREYILAEGLTASISTLFEKNGASVGSIDDDKFSPCTFAFKVVIDEYGDVFPCCRGELIGSVKPEEKKYFTVGNIFDEDPELILKKLKSDRSLFTTHLFGPGMSERLSGTSCDGNGYCQSCAASRHHSSNISQHMYEAAIALA